MPLILQEAMLKDPDMTYTYDPRQDQLILVLHNKINNQKRATENLEKPHGVKNWKADCRVMPCFQNWIKFYEKQVKEVEAYKPKDNFDPPFKYLMDTKHIPEVMFDIDEKCIQTVSQQIN